MVEEQKLLHWFLLSLLLFFFIIWSYFVMVLKTFSFNDICWKLLMNINKGYDKFLTQFLCVVYSHPKRILVINCCSTRFFDRVLSSCLDLKKDKSPISLLSFLSIHLKGSEWIVFLNLAQCMLIFSFYIFFY